MNLINSLLLTYSDYSSYGTEYEVDNEMIAGLSAGIIVFYLIFLSISFAVSILMIISQWIIFKKAGKGGWESIVPFYCNYVWFDITMGNGLYMLLLFVPIANIVFYILMLINLAKVFGKGSGFACGLLFLTPIFFPILAFGKSEYIGVQK